MALSASELPIIDFTKEAMKLGTTTYDLTSKNVVKALEEYGCFIARFSEINNELYTELFSSLKKFFDLPKDTKSRFTSNKTFEGYISESPRSPLLQTVQIPDVPNFQAIQNLTLCMWPQGDAAFSETIHSYVTRVLELETTVTNMICENYGVGKHFGKESESMKYGFRLMKYGAPMTDEDTCAGENHYDSNLITILQANGDGLQVQAKNGEWIGVTPSGSSLIVLIGESFHGWSNGRLKCCLHRVRMSGFKSRYSVAFLAWSEGKIEIPSELVDEEHPLLFKPFDVGGLVQPLVQQMMDKTYNKGNDDNMLPFVKTHFGV